jgi:hypothetical protein
MVDRLSSWSDLRFDFPVALEAIPEVSVGRLCNDEFILCNNWCVKVAFMHFVLDTM